MNLNEKEEAVKKLIGPKSLKEAEEEQRIGVEFFHATCDRLEPGTINDWLESKEWEYALIPVHLPKGLSELLKQMDEARTIIFEDDRCDRCESRIGCQLLVRNPSEILLTALLKLAFSTAIRLGQLK